MRGCQEMCLDVAWLSEDLFIICGGGPSDNYISVMSVDGDGPVTNFE